MFISVYLWYDVLDAFAKSLKIWELYEQFIHLLLYLNYLPINTVRKFSNSNGSIYILLIVVFKIIVVVYFLNCILSLFQFLLILVQGMSLPIQVESLTSWRKCHLG